MVDVENSVITLRTEWTSWFFLIEAEESMLRDMLLGSFLGKAPVQIIDFFNLRQRDER